MGTACLLAQPQQSRGTAVLCSSTPRVQAPALTCAAGTAAEVAEAERVRGSQEGQVSGEEHVSPPALCSPPELSDFNLQLFRGVKSL